MKSEIPANAPLDSQNLLNQIIVDYLKEKKRKRRWRFVMRIIMLFIILGLGFVFILKSNSTETAPHVGVIDLNGEISDAKVNADDFAKGLSKAYKNQNLKALIVRINSPGGSPVQAEYMLNTIKYYKTHYPEIKVYAVCADICASAAYYIAVGADEIYASPASIVGSIGVLFNGFGAVDLIEKIGVSRRLLTSGINKGFLDPFSPIQEDQKQKLQVMLNIIHQQFIARVKEGRGARLHLDDELFSGLFWTGEQALTKGLIDGFASSGQLARETIKIEKMIDYTTKQNWLDRVNKSLGTAMAEQLFLHLGITPGFH